MRAGNRTNVLLVELLIVVLFFILGSAILIQVFGKAHSMNERAGILVDAQREAMNTADLLQMAEDPAEALLKMQFVPSDDQENVWEKNCGLFELRVEENSSKETAQDNLRRMSVDAIWKDECLLHLPVSRFTEVLP